MVKTIAIGVLSFNFNYSMSVTIIILILIAWIIDLVVAQRKSRGPLKRLPEI